MTEEQPAEILAVLTTQALGNTVTHVLLGTAIVEIQDRDGNIHECRALLDSGSQIHFVTQDLCKRLKAVKSNFETTVSGINQAAIALKYRTQLRVQSKTTNFKTTITCLIYSKITDNIKIEKKLIEIPPGITLADPHFDDSRPIDLLIGAGLFWDLLCVGQIKAGNNQPYLQKTKLGWIITGSLEYQPNDTSRRVSCHMIMNAELHKQVEKFWAIEDCTTRSGAPPLDPLDPSERHFISCTGEDISGRFIVGLPFKDNKNQLSDSYNMAYNRLLAMERKFRRYPELQTKYIKFMQEYKNLKHMTRVPHLELENNKPAYYPPHHAVFKEQSTTTKLLVVCDGSAQTTSGLSLNDTRHAGYEVQDELFCILLRFRKHKYIIGCGKNVPTREEDRRYQRILWRTNPSQSAQTYQLNTVTYGTRAGAFLAKRCLRQIGENTKKISPEIGNIIINDFYVDDLLTGTDSIHKARGLKREPSAMLSTRGFELRQWVSNQPRVVEDLVTSDMTIQTDKDSKILGLKWITSTDKLSITANRPDIGKISKRMILSQIAQIFDPLGLVAPATICAKIILQRVWQLQLNWDESLPQDLHTTWNDFQQHLIDLNKIQISRRALDDTHVRLELHGFYDASEVAFGACIYLRSTDAHNNHTIHLLCAKSRVVPLKRLSLPRLELSAAVLLAHLVNKTTGALDTKIDEQYF